jgi:hypothetical protein
VNGYLELSTQMSRWTPPEGWPRYEKILIQRRYAAAHPKKVSEKAKQAK